MSSLAQGVTEAGIEDLTPHQASEISHQQQSWDNFKITWGQGCLIFNGENELNGEGSDSRAAQC